jgi:hypothetical protein
MSLADRWKIGAIQNIEQAMSSQESAQIVDNLFWDFDTMRFYWACKVAVEKPGNSVENFCKLDPIMDASLKSQFTEDFITTVVEWFDTQRQSSTERDSRAEMWKRKLAEDYLYFD